MVHKPPKAEVTGSNPVGCAICNIFYTQRHLISRCSLRQFRNEAMRVWKITTAAA